MVALLCFCFRKVAWKSKFSVFFFTFKEAMMAAFTETGAPTSRLYVAEQGVIIPNLSNTLPPCCLHSFGGCFHCNGCTHFQIIWSWTSCINSKFYQRRSKFFGCTPPFLPQKSSLKISILRVFLPLEKLWWLLTMKRADLFSQNM